MSTVTPSNLSATVLPRTTAISKGLLVFGGALFLAALAQVVIPVPGSPVPVTGQTLGVLLLATAYGANLGAATFALYLLIGLAGAPVFANQGHGIERLIGPTGGYLVGMLIASWVLGALAGRKWDQRFLSAITTMFIGNVIIFTFGLIWLHEYTGKDWAWTFSAGLTPFIFGEILKIVIAGTSLPALWKVVGRSN
ncbi:MAG: biotin transporter BioY [Candidatus Nanopelagicaceae bacterium]|nr:biotin transporter BioY [Candidatus Nanopelagicaceae bacterium]